MSFRTVGRSKRKTEGMIMDDDEQTFALYGVSLEHWEVHSPGVQMRYQIHEFRIPVPYLRNIQNSRQFCDMIILITVPPSLNNP